jgi:hypothetical protein
MAPQTQEANRESACKPCGGSGVITIRGGPVAPLMKEAGVFCPHCQEGRLSLGSVTKDHRGMGPFEWHWD